jgi:RNA polymerase sigma-70 factor (ECF subfamily)
MNESRLIAAAQRGDVAAFNQLVHAYRESVYHTAYRVLGERTAAACTAQAIFLSAYQTLRSFRGGSFKLWLFRMVVRVCRHSRDTYDRPIYPAQKIGAADEDGPSLDAILQMGLACLPMEERITVILSDLQGFAHDEIAQITGTPCGVVQSRLSCARDRLRRFLLAESELIPTDDRLYSRTRAGGDGGKDR